MTDDFRIRLQNTYAVRGSTAKRDHADDSLTSSTVHGDERQQHRSKHDSFELSEEEDDEGDAQKKDATDSPAPPAPDESGPGEDNGTGGIVNVRA